MFLVLEGIDGSGKSTQARLLKEHLERVEQRPVCLVREPGGTVLGESLRRLLLDPSGEDLAPEVETFLFMAARAHLCRQVIVPALGRGETVLSDRFLWSTVVYQGIVGGVGIDAVLGLARIACGSTWPTRTIWIDVEPEAAARRLGPADRLERRGVEYLRQVRNGFRALERRYPGEIRRVDGTGGVDEVHERVLRQLADAA